MPSMSSFSTRSASLEADLLGQVGEPRLGVGESLFVVGAGAGQDPGEPLGRGRGVLDLVGRRDHGGGVLGDGQHVSVSVQDAAALAGHGDRGHLLGASVRAQLAAADPLQPGRPGQRQGEQQHEAAEDQAEALVDQAHGRPAPAARGRRLRSCRCRTAALRSRGACSPGARWPAARLGGIATGALGATGADGRRPVVGAGDDRRAGGLVAERVVAREQAGETVEVVALGRHVGDLLGPRAPPCPGPRRRTRPRPPRGSGPGRRAGRSSGARSARSPG